MQPQPLDSGTLREAGEWLIRAQRDLQAARNELSVQPPLAEMTAYHAQQAAEKAFKSFLTASSTPFPHTHDLVRLQEQCEGIEPEFSGFLGSAQTLNPYATQFRYPGGQLAPSITEAQRAIELASGIVAFVQQRFAAPPWAGEEA